MEVDGTDRSLANKLTLKFSTITNLG